MPMTNVIKETTKTVYEVSEGVAYFHNGAVIEVMDVDNNDDMPFRLRILAGSDWFSAQACREAAEFFTKLAQAAEEIA